MTNVLASKIRGKHINKVIIYAVCFHLIKFAEPAQEGPFYQNGNSDHAVISGTY